MKDNSTKVLEDVSKRITRVETRLVKLLIANGLDADGNPLSASDAPQQQRPQENADDHPQADH